MHTSAASSANATPFNPPTKPAEVPAKQPRKSVPLGDLNTDMSEIAFMHSYCRPTGSKGEAAFIDKYLIPAGFKADRFNNYVLEIFHEVEEHGLGPIAKSSPIMWSSHVDTVHRSAKRGGSDQPRQVVAAFKEGKGSDIFLGLSDLSPSSCLGADDTAGIWLMLQMAKAGVPGLYVIHDAEEVGCVGSGHLADNFPSDWAHITTAIAFDRAGYHDVITHQAYGRTCSDDFAYSLADILNMGMKPDDGGIYTDTNSYAGIISECTNISVGYFKQHSTSEVLNMSFLMELRDALVGADWSKLRVSRDVTDFSECNGRYSYGGAYGSSSGSAANDYGFYSANDKYGLDADSGGAYGSADRALLGLVERYPALAADILESMGVDSQAFEDALQSSYGGTSPIIWGDDEDENPSY